MTAREAPRVPFAALIERGMIRPGETLFDAKRKVSALVRADGAVAARRCGRLDPSHRRARAGRRAPATAGPTGTSSADKKLTSIDDFRAEIRATHEHRGGVAVSRIPKFASDCMPAARERAPTRAGMLMSAGIHPGTRPMQQFDRAAEDLGNSIHLEHVNVQVPDQRLAQLFYAAGSG